MRWQPCRVFDQFFRRGIIEPESAEGYGFILSSFSHRKPAARRNPPHLALNTRHSLLDGSHHVLNSTDIENSFQIVGETHQTEFRRSLFQPLQQEIGEAKQSFQRARRMSNNLFSSCPQALVLLDPQQFPIFSHFL